MKTSSSGKHIEGLLKYNNSRKLLDEEVFIDNSTYARHHIKRRVIENKLIKYECAECGLGDTYNNKSISLQLDHMNGKNNDHRLCNLRFLCANCHSQQDTYAAKNRKNDIRVPKQYV